MPSGRVLYAFRMPVDLKRLCEAEAEKRGMTMTAFIVNACWVYLDGGVAPSEESSTLVDACGSNPQPASKLSIALAIPGVSLGMSKPTTPLPDAQPTTAEVAICGYAWWEDGAEYQCLMDRGHKAAKHGQHGMVVKIGE